MADSKKNNRYRNPANDLIDAAVGRTNKAASAVDSATKKSVKATSTAASRTIKKESEANSKDRSQLAKRKAELERRRKEAEKAKPKPTAKPPAKPSANPALSSTGIRDYAGRGANTKTASTGSKAYNEARNRQIATNRELLKTVGNPENNPSPAPSASRSSATTPTRSSVSTSNTAKPSPKPAPKPADKVPSGERRVSAATANRESGNYGTSRSNNPLMKGMTDRMRQREERDGVGPVKDGNRYAADMKNTTQGVGPVASGERYASGVKNGMPKNEQVKAKAPAPRTASKPRQRPGTGRDDMLSRYMEERKRRQSGQSRMIG